MQGVWPFELDSDCWLWTGAKQTLVEVLFWNTRTWNEYGNSQSEIRNRNIRNKYQMNTTSPQISFTLIP